ncbi:hypothetical protein B0H16DRAFT_1731605 [Mycena metata]|uniref:Uncharacterized protein n=1 Tax=Mycena metata TaxID=1033252 RepID=A0AAD7MVS8_9AGAR|nr:hypothetical protein B0H16DRAFT_1731605 [Mycena metata]
MSQLFLPTRRGKRRPARALRVHPSPPRHTPPVPTPPNEFRPPTLRNPTAAKKGRQEDAPIGSCSPRGGNSPKRDPARNSTQARENTSILEERPPPEIDWRGARIQTPREMTPSSTCKTQSKRRQTSTSPPLCRSGPTAALHAHALHRGRGPPLQACLPFLALQGKHEKENKEMRGNTPKHPDKPISMNGSFSGLGQEGAGQASNGRLMLLLQRPLRARLALHPPRKHLEIVRDLGRRRSVAPRARHDAHGQHTAVSHPSAHIMQRERATHPQVSASSLRWMRIGMRSGRIIILAPARAPARTHRLPTDAAAPQNDAPPRRPWDIPPRTSV